ncbi:MAG: SMC-Scp complex subunit ScpB [Clostridiales bacterium]|jgi:segregation and condensation protein B|nr:SMC-Scp complex subunit ScpB [Clostridiales bacterium]
MENLTQIIEAVIFSAGNGISKKDVKEKLIDADMKEINAAIDELKQKYGGASGVRLVTYNDKVQFASNSAYGEIVSDVLTQIKEKELSKTLLEVLAIIAYKQPVTRLDIEELRGVSSEYAVALLQKLNLIEPCGTKDAVGRPTLFATTDDFLKKFSLSEISDLPHFKEVMERVRFIEGGFNKTSESLYRDRGGEASEADGAERQIAAAVSEALDAETGENPDDKPPSVESDAKTSKRRKAIEAAALGAELERQLAESENPDFLAGEEFAVIE